VQIRDLGDFYPKMADPEMITVEGEEYLREEIIKRIGGF
jgi:hypothetical protein